MRSPWLAQVLAQMSDNSVIRFLTPSLRRDDDLICRAFWKRDDGAWIDQESHCCCLVLWISGQVFRGTHTQDPGFLGSERSTQPG
jgi:hypothetical protein